MQATAIAHQRTIVQATKIGSGYGQKKSVVVGLPSLRNALTKSRSHVVAQVFGGPGQEKKKLTREDEPEEYWSSEAERRGDSPFKDPLAIIGIVAILLPFVGLGIAIATGLVDVNGGR